MQDTPWWHGQEEGSRPLGGWAARAPPLARRSARAASAPRRQNRVLAPSTPVGIRVSQRAPPKWASPLRPGGRAATDARWPPNSGVGPQPLLDRIRSDQEVLFCVFSGVDSRLSGVVSLGTACGALQQAWGEAVPPRLLYGAARRVGALRSWDTIDYTALLGAPWGGGGVQGGTPAPRGAASRLAPHTAMARRRAVASPRQGVPLSSPPPASPVRCCAGRSPDSGSRRHRGRDREPEAGDGGGEGPGEQGAVEQRAFERRMVIVETDGEPEVCVGEEPVDGESLQVHLLALGFGAAAENTADLLAPLLRDMPPRGASTRVAEWRSCPANATNAVLVCFQEGDDRTRAAALRVAAAVRMRFRGHSRVVLGPMLAGGGEGAVPLEGTPFVEEAHQAFALLPAAAAAGSDSEWRTPEVQASAATAARCRARGDTLCVVLCWAEGGPGPADGALPAMESPHTAATDPSRPGRAPPRMRRVVVAGSAPGRPALHAREVLRRLTALLPWARPPPGWRDAFHVWLARRRRTVPRSRSRRGTAASADAGSGLASRGAGMPAPAPASTPATTPAPAPAPKSEPLESSDGGTASDTGATRASPPHPLRRQDTGTADMVTGLRSSGLIRSPSQARVRAEGLVRWLASLPGDFTQYAEPLLRYGVDSTEAASALGPDDVAALPLRPAHRALFLRHTAALRGGAAPSPGPAREPASAQLSAPAPATDTERGVSAGRGGTRGRGTPAPAADQGRHAIRTFYGGTSTMGRSERRFYRRNLPSTKRAGVMMQMGAIARTPSGSRYTFATPPAKGEEGRTPSPRPAKQGAPQRSPRPESEDGGKAVYRGSGKGDESSTRVETEGLPEPTDRDTPARIVPPLALGGGGVVRGADAAGGAARGRRAAQRGRLRQLIRKRLIRPRGDTPGRGGGAGTGRGGGSSEAPAPTAAGAGAGAGGGVNVGAGAGAGAEGRGGSGDGNEAAPLSPSQRKSLQSTLVRFRRAESATAAGKNEVEAAKLPTVEEAQGPRGAGPATGAQRKRPATSPAQRSERVAALPVGRSGASGASGSITMGNFDARRQQLREAMHEFDEEDRVWEEEVERQRRDAQRSTGAVAGEASLGAHSHRSRAAPAPAPAPAPAGPAEADAHGERRRSSRARERWRALKKEHVLQRKLTERVKKAEEKNEEVNLESILDQMLDGDEDTDLEGMSSDDEGVDEDEDVDEEEDEDGDVEGMEEAVKGALSSPGEGGAQGATQQALQRLHQRLHGASSHEAESAPSRDTDLSAPQGQRPRPATAQPAGTRPPSGSGPAVRRRRQTLKRIGTDDLLAATSTLLTSA